MSKLSILREFWDFLSERKKWWLAPIIIFFIFIWVLNFSHRRNCRGAIYLYFVLVNKIFNVAFFSFYKEIALYPSEIKILEIN